MPESVFHYRQAERNLKLVETLNLTPEKFWDWQVTALFYSADQVYLLKFGFKNE